MKKNIIRIIALIAVLIMAAAAFAACGKDDGKEKDKTGRVPGKEEEVPPTSLATREPEVTPVPDTGRTLSGTYYLVGIDDGTVRDFLFYVSCKGDEHAFRTTLGMIGLTEDNLSVMEYFVFDPDGTGTRYESHKNGFQTEKFTWTQEGSTVTWVGWSGEPHTLTVTDPDHFSYVFDGYNVHTRHFGR